MIDLHNPDFTGAVTKIKDADFAAPNETGLEYGAPARGLWNIVHTGMLLPESHQIFVCAQGCLRGVVLTAAEMGAMDRFSTIAVCEHNMLDGDMETLIINGVADIIGKLPERPKAVLLFTSCIHHFMGCDLDYVYARLRESFKDVCFTDCYMNPIMRKTKTPPDPMIRKRLYSFLKKVDSRDSKYVNIIGNNYPTEFSADFVRMLHSAGIEIRDITRCENFAEYQKMSESILNIAYMPAAISAVEDLKERLDMDYLFMPYSYNYAEIRKALAALAEKLNIEMIDCKLLEAEAEEKMKTAMKLLKERPVAIDYTATPRPLGLAKFLLEHGANVRIVYADAFIAAERETFEWLKENCPNLEIGATVHPKMGFLPRSTATSNEYLAIGQKAAYFKNTNYFVNMLEGGGSWGYDAVSFLADQICDAIIEEKDAKSIIQVKGWGCGCDTCGCSL